MKGMVETVSVMFQLITYLLAVYLVFKGFEILQLALTSGREDAGRSIALVLGGVALLISVIIAGTLFYMASQHGHGFRAILLGDIDAENPELQGQRRVDPPPARSTPSSISAAVFGTPD